MANPQKCKQVFISSGPTPSTLVDNLDGTYTFSNGIDPDVTFNVGGTDTDTRIRFVQVLPSGEWEWEVINVLTNTAISTFVTPAIAVQVQLFDTQAVPYTGVELPTAPGINIGDTNSTQFNDGTVVNYTWDGVNWIPKFLESWGEKRICLNTATPPFTPVDPNNPTITEVEAWKNANLSLLDQQNGTILTYFVPGDGGSCEDSDFIWVLNKGSELITLFKNRVKQSWVKELNLEQYSNRELLKSDNIYHEGKVSIGIDQFIIEYIQNINGNEYISGIQNSNFDYNRINTFSSISVNPLTGNDSVDPSLRPSTPFATLAAAVNFINSSSATGRNTITITGTTLATPLNTGSFDIFRGKAININANGQFINITGNINNYGIMVFNWGTYNFIANNRVINFYTAGFYAWTPTFNLSPTNTTVHFLFRVGSTGVFDSCNINYTGNNTAFYASENNSSILLFSTIFNNGGFTGLMLCRGLFSVYSHNNTCSLTNASWDSLSSQNIDVSNVTLWNDNRVYQGFTILPSSASLTANKVNISSGNLKFFNLPAFDNDASATIPIGTIYQTTATNTLGLPQGVIMIKQ